MNFYQNSRKLGRFGMFAALALALVLGTRAASAQTTIYQGFDSLPSFTTSDAGGGADATYSSVSGGAFAANSSNNCLQATHGTTSGSGARVITYTVPSGVSITVSAYL